MKHFSFATAGSDEDPMSDNSILLDDGIACNNVAALQQALMFLKGTLKAKEEGLVKLYKEKDAAFEPKLHLVTEKTEMAMMFAQAKREKEDAIEQVKLCKKEITEMSLKMAQLEETDEAERKSKFELMEVVLSEKA